MIYKKIFELTDKLSDKEILKTRSGSWTINEIIQDINEAANRIESFGMQPNEPLGLAFPNCREFIIFLLACEMTGHPAVLLGAMLKPREIIYHVKNSGIKKMLASPRLSKFMEEAGGVKQDKTLLSEDFWLFENKEVKGLAFGDVVCQLTSGTNGMSKGVIRTSVAILSELETVINELKLTDEDTVLVIPPIHHAFGLMLGALPALCSGARLILMDGFIPADVRKTIEEEKVSAVFAVPFMYHLLNQSTLSSSPDFSSLRVCVTGGASLHHDVTKAFLDRFGQVIYNSYGSTETGAMTISKDTFCCANAVGKPLANRDIRAFDENGILLPPGETGLLFSKSEANARRYLYPENLNEDAFRNGWYNTGDMGSVDEDGVVYVAGRKNNMINVAGLKVDPSEVEEVIAGIDGIKEVVVVGINNGAGGHVVKAVIVSDKVVVDKKHILDVCKKNLADYKLPRVIEFVDQLPRSQTGKILRKCLI